MVQFRSSVYLETQARDLIIAYSSLVHGSLHELLNHPDGGPHAMALDNATHHLESLVNSARAIIDDPGFAALATDLQHDVTAVMEEGAAAIVEMRAEAHPDHVWEGMQHHEKRHAVQHQRIDRNKAKSIHAILTLDARAARNPKPVADSPIRTEIIVDVTDKKE